VSNPYRGQAHHWGVASRDFAWHVNQSRRFFTLAGLPLATVEEVRAALKAEGEVVSR
jgi:hypothetical protein